MNRRSLIAATLTTLVLTGCQAMRVIERPTPAEIGRLDAGDRVGLLLEAGTSMELTVTGATATHLNGVAQGREVSVPVETIVEVRYHPAAERSVAERLRYVLAMVAASFALASGDQDSVNRKSEYAGGRNP